jgi:membrane dipeptidase
MGKTLLLLMFSGASLLLNAADGDKMNRKAEKIHRKIITLDSHNDTPLRMMQKGFDMAVRHDPKVDRSRVDLPRMKEGGLDGAFFAVFVSQGSCDSSGYSKARRKVSAMFDTINSMLSRNDSAIELALSPEDAERLKAEGKRILFIGMENGYPLGRDTGMIRHYFRKGARYITLCHTTNNDICTSSTDSVISTGLNPFGVTVVKKMNELGMMIDVSHASDKAFYDILQVSCAPVIASHSCARALCDNPRNLDDSMLMALARNGGVVQMCILSEYVKKSPLSYARDSAWAALRKKYNNFDNLSEEQMNLARKEWYAIDDLFPVRLATVQDVVDHIDHIVQVAGIDHAGIGTDFDGGGGVKGCRDVSEMKNITIELLHRGYRKKEIEKIWGGNLLRVMKANATLTKNIVSGK